MGHDLGMTRTLACLALGAVLASCGGSPAGQAQSQADTVTKAVYNNDADGAQQNFEPALKSSITRAQVGMLSDKLHKLGDYKGLTYVSNDALKNEYTYRADFTNGSAPVVLRLDAEGKIAAYRIGLQ
ncbi:MAG TPA: hypothetical protein VFO29_06220 [Candidatus Rubrimentiphilum sp.]|nr:hypothetical protein [Candidatus Rubrimentiphilum sp.]